MSSGLFKNVSYKVIHLQIIEQDLVLNTLYGLICHKIQLTNHLIAVNRIISVR